MFLETPFNRKNIRVRIHLTIYVALCFAPAL
uniref:Uncharacterized protein n=1 Tax=virus sp. ctBM815 TaxID=2825806 RepID=A0A8S5RL17_9VIRU|nr:MAG TPA: hypothetical protein [virus sp. ctBM815]